MSESERAKRCPPPKANLSTGYRRSAYTFVTMKAARALQTARTVAVLSGAGISADSGVPTFRGAGGLWRNHRPEDLATPAAYARNPTLVWQWYRERLSAVSAARPNPAHLALADLASRTSLTLVTQNVDGLHERAGSRGVLELHGNITHSRCERCAHLDKLSPDFSVPPHCLRCGNRARPNVVWFGESLPGAIFEAATDAFAAAEVALVIGTSGVVEPAAGLARLAKNTGAYLIEVNPEPTPLSAVADSSLRLSAAEGVPKLLQN